MWLACATQSPTTESRPLYTAADAHGHDDQTSGAIEVRLEINVDRLIEAFVHGFCFTRSFTHPYVAERVGPVWVVRAMRPCSRGDYRREEWIAHGVPPAEVDRLARADMRGGFAICRDPLDGRTGRAAPRSLQGPRLPPGDAPSP